MSLRRISIDELAGAPEELQEQGPAAACTWDQYRIPPYLMGHIEKDKAKLIARVRRLRGQMEAIEGAIGTAPCGEILNLVASVRGAVNGLMAELIEDHVREHVINARSASERNEGASELIDVVKAYLR